MAKCTGRECLIEIWVACFIDHGTETKCLLGIELRSLLLLRIVEAERMGRCRKEVAACGSLLPFVSVWAMSSRCWRQFQCAAWRHLRTWCPWFLIHECSFGNGYVVVDANWNHVQLSLDGSTLSIATRAHWITLLFCPRRFTTICLPSFLEKLFREWKIEVALVSFLHKTTLRAPKKMVWVTKDDWSDLITYLYSSSVFWFVLAAPNITLYFLFLY